MRAIFLPPPTASHAAPLPARLDAPQAPPDTALLCSDRTRDLPRVTRSARTGAPSNESA